MELSIDMLKLDNADAFIIWIKKVGFVDKLIFLDSGKEGDGQKIIEHYELYIESLASKNGTPKIILINTHPHNDHIKGMPILINYFQEKITRVYLNNPLNFISQENLDLLEANYNKTRSQDTVLTRLYQSLEQVHSIVELLNSYKVPVYKALSDIPKHFDDESDFQFIGPSAAFYEDLVNRFSNPTYLNESMFKNAKKLLTGIDENAESTRPCPIVDEKDDTCPENLASVLTSFSASNGNKYLFTGDAGVESFESAKFNGFRIENYTIVQLPHHGSRRNISTQLIQEFLPKQFIVSAKGSLKHPRKAVIECIKKNTTAAIYSTHRTGSFWTTSDNVFGLRNNYSPAIPL